jgi:hypothetical protein
MALSFLGLTAQAAGAGTVVYSNTQQIANNLAYTNTISYINGTQRQMSYALNLTGKGDAYPIIMADDTIYGSMTIDKVINYAEGQGKNVLAAVNTDFFSMKTGGQKRFRNSTMLPLQHWRGLMCRRFTRARARTATL